MPILTHHALLVGIDCYPNLPAHNQLHSCANDARLLGEVLRSRYGFRDGEVTLLLNADATRDGILGAFEALRQAAQEDDAIVFFYSGHGSQLVAANNYEPDELYETLVPHDGGLAEGSRRDIRDEEIYTWLLGMSTVTRNIVVIADTCFSGHIARSSEREKWIPAARLAGERPRRPGDEMPTRGANPRPRSAGGAGFRRTRDAGTPSSFLPCDERYVLLAACRTSEHAKELVWQPQSAFTFCLCRELLRVPEGATYRDLIERVRPAVAAEVVDQTPQLEGARDRLLFDQAASPPTPFLSVLERQDTGLVRLAGGAVHGVEPGSVWAVHPAGTLHPTPGQEQGLVRIQTVEAVESAGLVTEERGRIEAGARAFEHAKPPGWLRLSVQAPGAGAFGAMGVTGTMGATGVTGEEEIRRWIAGHGGAASLLRLPEPGEDAAVRIAAFPASQTAPSQVNPPTAFQLDQPSLLALDRDGSLLLPPAPIREPDALPQLLRGLEDLARARNLRAVTSDDAGPNSLASKVQVTLLRRRGDTTFEPAEPGPGGDVIYREGELLALRITHQVPQPIYLHILDIGLFCDVTLLYPIPGANDAIFPNHPFDIATRPGQTWSVGFPKGFEARARAARDAHLEGRETLRIFATTQEADLTGWQSPAARGGPPSPQGGSLARRLDQALGARAMRGDSTAEGTEEMWAVLDVSFVVMGKG
jgi:hypothetical protein